MIDDSPTPRPTSDSDGWRAHEVAQLHRFRALSLREKLEAVEGMADVVRRFEKMRREGAFRSGTRTEPVKGIMKQSDVECSMSGEDKFKIWFKQATDNQPYPFQIRFACDPELPALIDVPTGMGKTATAVLGWLWRRRFADEQTRKATPRRLVYCLPMRVLVEQTVSEARRWIDELKKHYPKEMTQPLNVYILMGGEIDNDWDAYPEADAILIGTQDQLLSRALNRGYAMSRYRWPMHFGC